MYRAAGLSQQRRAPLRESLPINNVVPPGGLPIEIIALAENLEKIQETQQLAGKIFHSNDLPSLKANGCVILRARAERSKGP